MSVIILAYAIWFPSPSLNIMAFYYIHINVVCIYNTFIYQYPLNGQILSHPLNIIINNIFILFHFLLCPRQGSMNISANPFFPVLSPWDSVLEMGANTTSKNETS